MSEQVFVDSLADSKVIISGPVPTSLKASEGGVATRCTSLFFPGCSFINADPALVGEVFDCLRAHGVVDGISLLCCGKILDFEEDAATVKSAFHQELAHSIVGHGVKRIVAACPNCVEQLRDLVGLFEESIAVEVVPLPQVLLDMGLSISADMVEAVLAQDDAASGGADAALERAGRKRLPVITIHDSCPDRATGEFASSVRALFPPEIIAEKAHNRERAFCCGSLTNALGRPDVARSQAREHGAEAQDVGAQALVSYCTSCARFLAAMQDSVPSHHYLEFLFGRRLDWKSMPPHLEVRFLFDEMKGKRSFKGAASPRPAREADVADAKDGLQPCGQGPRPVRETKKTNCHFCGYLCAFEAEVEDGRVVGLACDPTRYPYDENVLRGCRRWPMNLKVLDDPKRVNYPLRRVGERGSGQWERVSWDEALDDIAARLGALIEKHGPQTLASAIGGPHASYWPLHRFMNLLGSPNNMGIGQICWNPRIWMEAVTFGWTVEADIDPARTGALFIWGTNPAQSDNSAFWRSLLAFAKSDVPLVVIDPRRTQVAAKADLWLPVRPGTDCALALGLIHVIIEEGLYDQEFIEQWCHGFDELADAAKEYTPARVAEACGLDAQDIQEAARIFASAPAAALVSGRGVDQGGRAVAPAHRAIACLRAITGNVDRPGSCVLTEQSDFVPEADLEMSALLGPEQRAFCLNTPYTPLQSYEGYAKVNGLTERLGRSLPLRYLTSAHPDLVLKAMLEGSPYPVRALFVEATNPLLTYGDTHRVFEALSSLDLLVVLEYYMTPTASLADYVLPAAGAMERPLFQAHGGVANIGYGGPAAVEPYYERRADYDFFREMGIRFGQAEHWPDGTLEDAYRTTLAPTGMTWEEFCRTGIYCRPPGFFKHERLGADGKPVGFATTTGKIELASEVLPELGGPRLPQWEQGGQGDGMVLSHLMGQGDGLILSHFAKEAPDSLPTRQNGTEPGRPPVPSQAKGGRLALITGARKQPYNASMFLNIEAFREGYPAPLAEMSPATAKGLGLVAGDTVVLATDQGQARFTLKTAAMRDGLVSADYGWWFPEWEPGAPGFGGIWESNVNLLTDCSVSKGEAMIGSWPYNALECAVWKSDEKASPMGASAP